MERKDQVLLEVRDLCKYFPVRQKGLWGRSVMLRAVDGVTFQIRQGEVFGLVGESGCGKSTLGQTILQLYRPTSGQVLFEGQNLAALKKKELRALRRQMQIIFQDPYSSLDPRMPIGHAIAEPMIIHKLASGNELNERVDQLLVTVGLGPGLRNRYPHEFSGGQQQRIAIARALAVDPSFMVADEPISAMDVSIQAQLVNLMDELQQQMGLTYLFISHDLRMVRHISNRVAVMYLGHIVEIADRDQLYENPLHPYTKALLSTVPLPNPRLTRSRQRIRLEGDVPSPIGLAKGCVFQSRCYLAAERCRGEAPVLKDVGDNHSVACFFAP